MTLLAPAARAAPAHPEVLVVVNDASAMSVAIGEAYLRLRGVPAQNLVHLQVPLGDDAALKTAAHERIDRAGYTARVREPIARFLRENDPGGRIRILVTTKGVPLRVDDDQQCRVGRRHGRRERIRQRHGDGRGFDQHGGPADRDTDDRRADGDDSTGTQLTC